ncbi:MAG: PEP-utilizing enzyme [Candidatus Paceibacterota bacterium]|jgi:phosphohistidine swiveling domain-containing protein
MNLDIQKFAERKYPLFSLYVSQWQHNLALKNTVGLGFTNSVFAHKEGVCVLAAPQEEIDNVCDCILDCIKNDDGLFRDWYEKAKVLNTKADKLLAEAKSPDFIIDGNSFNQVLDLFSDNLGYCTILPFWVLYAINQSIEKGLDSELFGSVRKMYEELKSETRYPQLLHQVISKYLNKAEIITGYTSRLVSCLNPDELRNILAVKDAVSSSDLKRRMSGCTISLKKIPYEIDFSYDLDTLSKLFIDHSTHDFTELKGSVAYKGIVRGKVSVINSIDDMKKFKEGDVLVSIQSSPSLMPALLKCSAIITDEGGIMCHASIISRELKKPCIIGTKIATKVLKDGDIVEVDANNGIIKILDK